MTLRACGREPAQPILHSSSVSQLHFSLANVLRWTHPYVGKAVNLLMSV